MSGTMAPTKAQVRNQYTVQTDVNDVGDADGAQASGWSSCYWSSDGSGCPY